MLTEENLGFAESGPVPKHNDPKAMELHLKPEDYGVSIPAKSKDDGWTAKGKSWIAVVQYGEYAII